MHNALFYLCLSLRYFANSLLYAPIRCDVHFLVLRPLRVHNHTQPQLRNLFPKIAHQKLFDGIWSYCRMDVQRGYNVINRKVPHFVFFLLRCFSFRSHSDASLGTVAFVRKCETLSHRLFTGVCNKKINDKKMYK